MCCFSYGKNVIDKRGVETLDVMMVNQRSCEDSAKWSDGLAPGQGYEDVDIPETALPAPAADERQAPEPEDKSYETLSRKIYNSYKILAGDKKEWLEGIDDSKVISEANQFKEVDIDWSEDLAAIALAFENSAAPCDSEVNADGDSLMVFALDIIEDYDELHLLSYEGPFTEDPKDVISDQLRRGRFDKDQFYGRFEEMGVGCTCNGAKGMECLMIFGSGIELGKKFDLKPEWTPIVQKPDCIAKCVF